MKRLSVRLTPRYCIKAVSFTVSKMLSHDWTSKSRVTRWRLVTYKAVVKLVKKNTYVFFLRSVIFNNTVTGLCISSFDLIVCFCSDTIVSCEFEHNTWTFTITQKWALLHQESGCSKLNDQFSSCSSITLLSYRRQNFSSRVLPFIVCP